MEKIIIQDKRFFNPTDIFECGQIFRYNKKDDGGYEVFSLDKHAYVVQTDGGWQILTEDPEYFSNFFDLNRDYQQIVDTLSAESTLLKNATDFGAGIRILKQPTEEMIFSFIISANNNIKRIQKIIEKLCFQLGKSTKYGYAFPTVEALASKNEDFYQSIGCGYRASYIVDTAKKLNSGFDMNILKNSTTIEAKQMLLTLKGVGNKVADCILLFGLGKTDVFPVDTWIKKVYHKYFETGLPDNQIAEFFVNKFKDLAGFSQQYLFYFVRTMDK